jgi:hypothetical protein
MEGTLETWSLGMPTQASPLSPLSRPLSWFSGQELWVQMQALTTIGSVIWDKLPLEDLTSPSVKWK